jgi:DNA-binding NtrC family response regulator
MVAKILIVEDEFIPRQILTKVLTRDGHEVRAAGDAKEAVAAGREFQPDILLADWLLTDTTSGLSVAEQLRKIHPRMRILFFTGLPTHKLEMEAQHLRPVRFLEKPCEFSIIRAAIQSELSEQDRDPSPAATRA